MPNLFILIQDVALREAVVEQIMAAKLGEPRIVGSVLSVSHQKDEENPNVIIIDDAGFDKQHKAILQAWGGNQGQKPTILLLGGTDDLEEVDETFAKPLRLGHLVARLHYYLETAPLLRDHIVRFGPFRLEPKNRRILRENNSEPIRLTEKETALLVFLANRKEPASRQDILAAVWGYDERIDTHTLETHIYQLRRKLENSGKDDGSDNLLINEAGTYRLARESK